MALYRYTALDERGKKVKGVIDAESFSLAKERLHQEKILVVRLNAGRKKGAHERLPKAMLPQLFKELSLLLRASLPLYDALVALCEKYRKASFHPLLLSLSDQLREGKSLSAIVERYPLTFNPVMRCMIRTGEKSGSLEQTFSALHTSLEREQKLKKELVGALTYPLLLLAFSACVIVGLLFFVIPSLSEFLEGDALRPLTAQILALSAWANAHPLLFFFTPCATIGALYTFYRTGRGKALFSACALRIPLVKSLLLHGSLERFCRNARTLLHGGTPLVEAIGHSASTLHPLMQEHLSQVSDRVAQGERLSYALKRIPRLPMLFLHMIALAEETGKMEDAFLHLTLLYEEEVHKHLAQLTALLQPLFLLLLGGIVGLIVFSVILPLTDAGALMTG